MGFFASLETYNLSVFLESELIIELKFLKFSNYFQILLVLLPKDGSDIAYKFIKKFCEVAENNMGILTQCIAHKTIEKGKINRMLGLNFCLKMNAKLGGTNWIVVDDQLLGKMRADMAKGRGTMFIGADVFHPPPAVNRRVEDVRPSIAGVFYFSF